MHINMIVHSSHSSLGRAPPVHCRQNAFIHELLRRHALQERCHGHLWLGPAVLFLPHFVSYDNMTSSTRGRFAGHKTSHRPRIAVARTIYASSHINRFPGSVVSIWVALCTSPKRVTSVIARSNRKSICEAQLSDNDDMIEEEKGLTALQTGMNAVRPAQLQYFSTSFKPSEEALMPSIRVRWHISAMAIAPSAHLEVPIAEPQRLTCWPCGQCHTVLQTCMR
jgi:hypothetical protein